MLKLSAALLNVPVMSLRTGQAVGKATKIILNPNNLKVEGWFVADRFNNKKLILPASEVREIASQGIIINDHEVLSTPDELVRLDPVLKINFELVGKHVMTENGKKLGKVSDFAVEVEALIVKKIYATQSIVKSFSGSDLSIDRTQIIEITDKRIIVDDLTVKAEANATSPVPIS